MGRPPACLRARKAVPFSSRESCVKPARICVRSAAPARMGDYVARLCCGIKTRNPPFMPVELGSNFPARSAEHFQVNSNRVAPKNLSSRSGVEQRRENIRSKTGESERQRQGRDKRESRLIGWRLAQFEALGSGMRFSQETLRK